MDTSHSYYEILNVSRHSTDAEIRRAYHMLAKKFHPDRHLQNKRLAELRFRLINEAYAALKTRERRAVYNRHMRLKAENDNAAQKSGFFSRLGEMLRSEKAGETS